MEFVHGLKREPIPPAKTTTCIGRRSAMESLNQSVDFKLFESLFLSTSGTE